MKKGYVDRFTSTEEAVLLIEDTKETIYLAKEYLPSNTMPGDWVSIQFNGTNIISVRKDPQMTNQMKSKNAQKLAKLKKKKKSTFKRS